MNDRPPYALIWLIAVSWLIAAHPAAIRGQVQMVPQGAAEDFNNIFLPAPRGLRQQLARAERALEEERYGEAVDLLGQLLADSVWDDGLPEGQSRQDYFLTDAEASGTRVSLKAQAQRLLGSMPEQGRDLYELKFGADARRLLDTALRDRDFHQLVEVTRRYFHTRAGYEATMLLGRHYLDRGQPLAAAMRFQRLEGNAAAESSYEPELSVLLATCWLLAGMPDRAEATLLSLKGRDPGATIRIGDRNVSLFAEDENAFAWLERLIGSGFPAGAGEASEWVIYRGDAARNAQSAGGFPLLNARWRVRAANHPSDEEIIAQQQRQYREQGIPALPGLHPLAVADVVVMRTPRRLIAVDFETGKRIWEFPWFEAPDEEVLQSDRIRPDRLVVDPVSMELSRRIWDDAPYGQMSSDGRQIFLLWGLGADPRQPPVRIQIPGRQVPNPLGASDANKLVSLDLRAQGKLRWIVGDTDGTDEPQLAGAFFLGAPLPLMGQLYALVEINSEIRLVVLDAETGRLEWSQQLAHVDVRDIASDPVRRAAGASPSFSDGVLICPTSAGAVVAVDVSTRALLWGYQYPQGTRPLRQGISIYPYATKAVGERWADATVTIADGRVLLTPAESDQLYCLDLLTGKIVWEPQPRNQLLFTGCVRDGKAVMVGADRLQAISLADGSAVWTTELLEGMPSGRGIVTADSYYLPTTAGQLLQFDLATGALSREIRTDHVLGNLVAFRDQIISQNVDWLAAYYQSQPLRDVVARRLAEDADDGWALARQGELLLYDGRYAEAVSVFRGAYALDPNDDAVRGALVQALLTALEQDFPTHRTSAEELRSLMDQPAQQAEFHRLMAVGFQRLGEVDKAVESFVKLAAMDFAGELEGESSDRTGLMRVESNRKIRRDRWIRTHMADLLASATDDARQRIDSTVSNHLDDVLRGESIVGLTRFVDHFGDHALGIRARLHLAELLLRRDRLLEAQQHLIDLQRVDDASVAASATALLADLLRDRGHLREAISCYELLAERWGDVTTATGATGREVAAQAGNDPVLLAATDPAAPWPYGKCVVATETQAASNAAYLSLFPIELTAVQGPFPDAMSLVYDRQRNAVVLRDRHGKPVHHLLLGEVSRFLPSSPSAPVGAAEAKGHLLVLQVGTEVIAFDTLRGDTGRGEVILWRQDLSSSLVGRAGTVRLISNPIQRSWGPTRHAVSESGRAMGSMGPITEYGVIYQKLNDLICVDPLTGDTIWTLGGVDAGSDVFGDERFVFVVAPDDDQATVVRTADGAALGTRYVATRRDRWVTSGRHVLVCQQKDGKLQLRWLDAWHEQDLWTHSFDIGAQCWLPAPDEVAVLEPSGRFVVLGLSDGERRVESELDAEPDLARLYVQRNPDRYLVVACRRDTDGAAPAPRYFGTLEADSSPEINGRIHAVDRTTGKRLWPSAAEVRQFRLPLEQPADSPALVFLNNYEDKSVSNTPRAAISGQALCIDKRDGRQLLLDRGFGMIRTFSVETEPDLSQVVIKTNTKQFLLQFTDEPVTPEPPVQMDQPVAPASPMQQAGKIAQAILQAIVKPKPPAPPPAPADQPAEEAPPDDAAKKGPQE